MGHRWQLGDLNYTKVPKSKELISLTLIFQPTPHFHRYSEFVACKWWSISINGEAIWYIGRQQNQQHQEITQKYTNSGTKKIKLKI